MNANWATRISLDGLKGCELGGFQAMGQLNLAAAQPHHVQPLPHEGAEVLGVGLGAFAVFSHLLQSLFWLLEIIFLEVCGWWRK